MSLPALPAKLRAMAGKTEGAKELPERASWDHLSACLPPARVFGTPGVHLLPSGFHLLLSAPQVSRRLLPRSRDCDFLTFMTDMCKV